MGKAYNVVGSFFESSVIPDDAVLIKLELHQTSVGGSIYFDGEQFDPKRISVIATFKDRQSNEELPPIELPFYFYDVKLYRDRVTETPEKFNVFKDYFENKDPDTKKIYDCRISYSHEGVTFVVNQELQVWPKTFKAKKMDVTFVPGTTYAMAEDGTPIYYKGESILPSQYIVKIYGEDGIEGKRVYHSKDNKCHCDENDPSKGIQYIIEGGADGNGEYLVPEGKIDEKTGLGKAKIRFIYCGLMRDINMKSTIEKEVYVYKNERKPVLEAKYVKDENGKEKFKRLYYDGESIDYSNIELRLEYELEKDKPTILGPVTKDMLDKGIVSFDIGTIHKTWQPHLPEQLADIIIPDAETPEFKEKEADWSNDVRVYLNESIPEEKELGTINYSITYKYIEENQGKRIIHEIKWSSSTEKQTNIRVHKIIRMNCVYKGRGVNDLAVNLNETIQDKIDYIYVNYIGGKTDANGVLIKEEILPSNSYTIDFNEKLGLQVLKEIKQYFQKIEKPDAQGVKRTYIKAIKKSENEVLIPPGAFIIKYKALDLPYIEYDENGFHNIEGEEDTYITLLIPNKGFEIKRQPVPILIKDCFNQYPALYKFQTNADQTGNDPTSIEEGGKARIFIEKTNNPIPLNLFKNESEYKDGIGEIYLTREQEGYDDIISSDKVICKSKTEGFYRGKYKLIIKLDKDSENYRYYWANKKTDVFNEANKFYTEDKEVEIEIKTVISGKIEPKFPYYFYNALPFDKAQNINQTIFEFPYGRFYNDIGCEVGKEIKISKYISGMGKSSLQIDSYTGREPTNNEIIQIKINNIQLTNRKTLQLNNYVIWKDPEVTNFTLKIKEGELTEEQFESADFNSNLLRKLGQKGSDTIGWTKLSSNGSTYIEIVANNGSEITFCYEAGSDSIINTSTETLNSFGDSNCTDSGLTKTTKDNLISEVGEAEASFAKSTYRTIYKGEGYGNASRSCYCWVGTVDDYIEDAWKLIEEPASKRAERDPVLAADKVLYNGRGKDSSSAHYNIWPLQTWTSTISSAIKAKDGVGWHYMIYLDSNLMQHTDPDESKNIIKFFKVNTGSGGSGGSGGFG